MRENWPLSPPLPSSTSYGWVAYAMHHNIKYGTFKHIHIIIKSFCKICPSNHNTKSFTLCLPYRGIGSNVLVFEGPVSIWLVRPAVYSTHTSRTRQLMVATTAMLFIIEIGQVKNDWRQCCHRQWKNIERSGKETEAGARRCLDGDGIKWRTLDPVESPIICATTGFGYVVRWCVRVGPNRWYGWSYIYPGSVIINNG